MEELKAALAKMREMYAAQGEELHDLKVAQATLMRTAQQIERERDALLAQVKAKDEKIAALTAPAGDKPAAKKAKGEAVATA